MLKDIDNRFLENRSTTSTANEKTGFPTFDVLQSVQMHAQSWMWSSRELFTGMWLCLQQQGQDLLEISKQNKQLQTDTDGARVTISQLEMQVCLDPAVPNGLMWMAR